VLARGLGRSYGDAAVNDGGAVCLMERLNRFLAFDPATGVVEAEAGLSLATLVDVLLPRGFFPPVTPGTKHVTLGGALAADVHGKNHHHDGSFATAVESFTLLGADGVTRRCSRTENADRFWATVGGMGLTGVVRTVRLKLLPVPSAYLAVHYQKTRALEETMQLLRESEGTHRYSIAWVDLASWGRWGSGVVMVGDHAPVELLDARQRRAPLERPAKSAVTMPCPVPSFFFRRGMFVLANAAYRLRFPTKGTRIEAWEPYFYPLDVVDRWNRAYGSRGFRQFQCVVPFEAAANAFVEMREMMRKHRAHSTLAVLKTFGEGNEGWLSFPRRGYTLAMDFANRGEPTRILVRELGSIAHQYGGRIYLAKDSVLDPLGFFSTYPKASEFRRKLSEWDPERRFQSTLARRLGLFEEN
jgi:FAD/FMN-containing dehydrogenase